jgi:hypothetical protein
VGDEGGQVEDRRRQRVAVGIKAERLQTPRPSQHRSV